MIGSYNLANNDNNVQVFYTIGTGLWQTWQKPKGYRFAQIFILGGGGGGGAGASGGTNASRSGGAGGGSSGISRLFLPLSLIPDTLYVSVGLGGVGGTATAGTGNNGLPGELSYISVQPNTSVANMLVASGNAAATAGSGGLAGSANAIAGSASTIFTTTNGLLSHITHFNFIAGQAGAGGGNQNQSGTAITLTNITSGGAGGAGVSTVSRDGANVTGLGFVPTIRGGIIATLSEASSGFSSFNESLFNMRRPLFFTGGAGGYANRTSTGGLGGNGAFGCGGGGGGGGTTGGRGGNGGNGLVIITCW